MKALVEVTQLVEVTIDVTKFTPAFMAEFRASFFPFHELNEHIEHLAQLHARGVFDLEFKKSFVEGYGFNDAMGISAVTVDTETAVQDPDTYRIAAGGDA